MYKTELIRSMKEQSGLSQADCERALDAFIESVTQALIDGDSVNLIGFGSFSVKERAARTGRNPQTGKEMLIPASKTVAFKMGKNLKDYLSSASENETNGTV